MKKLFVISLILCLVDFCGAEDAIYKKLGSHPALCEIAPLPKDQAERMAKLAQEQKQKLIRQGDYLPNVDGRVLNNVAKYVTTGVGKNECDIKAPGKFTIAEPVLKITNSSHGIGYVESDVKNFNLKKDRMSNAVLSKNNEIVIVNHKNKTCNMADFTFSTESNAIKMEGNKIVFTVPTLNIAAGNYPSKYKITCVHVPSGVKYNYDVVCAWRDYLSLGKEDYVYTFDVLGSDSFPDLALMGNLKTNQLEVVRLPITLNAEGYDGSNGTRGSNGRNGIDEYTWQDKDGKTHQVKGTCAQPGQDGSNGSDGQPGGTFLICVSELLLKDFGSQSIITLVEGGKGGKGGAGGKGGIHGKGSPCYTVTSDGSKPKAADGKPGRDGVDGKRGDFLFVVADVVGFYLNVFNR